MNAMNARSTTILNLLGERKKITVAELSELLKVSDVTIRKDLAILEEKGLLRREHGFATMTAGDDVGKRISFNYDVKRRIAEKAAEFVQDGETIMIESGSCCALLAEEIVTKRRYTTIITNSAFISAYVRKKLGARIILLGGK